MPTSPSKRLLRSPFRKQRVTKLFQKTRAPKSPGFFHAPSPITHQSKLIDRKAFYSALTQRRLLHTAWITDNLFGDASNE
jgi:hypothetical protein